MKFCQPHWDGLRAAIEKRGLIGLVAKSGEAAAERMKAELDGDATDDTYDPLMAAHWAIVNNTMSLLNRFGLDATPLMLKDSDHPDHECPICYLNFLSSEHDRTCTDPDCQKPKGQKMDQWIDRAADDALDYCKSHNLINSPLPSGRK